MIRVARAYLAISALAFFAIGLNTLLDPARAMAGVELLPGSVSALNEVRANYGGLQVAFGLMLAAGALRTAWTDGALWVSAAICGGLLAGRLLSLMLDGAPNTTVQMLAGIEAVSLLLAAGLLWRRRADAASQVEEGWTR